MRRKPPGMPPPGVQAEGTPYSLPLPLRSELKQLLASPDLISALEQVARYFREEGFSYRPKDGYGGVRTLYRRIRKSAETLGGKLAALDLDPAARLYVR